MISDQDTIEDDMAARRVRDMVARSQESALTEVRHSTLFILCFDACLFLFSCLFIILRYPGVENIV